MSPEVSLLQEVWQIVKNHIHIKERTETAEALLEAFEDHLDMEELELYANEFDKSMKTAFMRRVEEEEYDDEYEEDEPDW